MFNTRKSLKETNNSILLQEAQNRFSEIKEVIGEIIQRNASEDLNIPFETKKKSRINKASDDLTLNKEPEYMLPKTTQAMRATILPSTDYWSGIEEKKNESDSKAEFYKDVKKFVPFALLSFSNNESYTKKQNFVRIKNYVFTVNTPILGLNQHLINPYIYFSVSPNYGFEHKIPPKIRTEEETVEVLKQFGQQYLAAVINHVNESHNKISCIVIGDRQYQENMEAYEAYDPWLFVNDSEDVVKNIEQYYLPKEYSAAKTDVTVYNIDASGHDMRLSSTDLETVHQVAVSTQKKKKGKNEAIIVHCQQGKDRTGMLIFALILFENYKKCFTIEKSADKIYAVYKTLQWSRSPQALSNMADFVNAIFLAHTLQAIEIEKKCITNLVELIIKDKRMSERKQATMIELQKIKKNEDKIDFIEKELSELMFIQNKNNYILHNSKKRRPRSESCNESLQVMPTLFKKSSSAPDDLQTNNEVKITLENDPENFDKLKIVRKNSMNILEKPNRNTISSDLKNCNSIINNESHMVNETKDADFTISFTPILSLPSSSELNSNLSNSIELYASKEKSENPEIISEKNNKANKSLKYYSSKLSTKSNSEKPDVMKEPNMNNILKDYVAELTCYKDAILHRINTETALQYHIEPKDMINEKDESRPGKSIRGMGVC